MVALGAPVGRRDERLDLLWQFRELADANAARAGIYGVGPEDLPDLVVSWGFSIQKIGETAAVPLDTFSPLGGGRANLRRSWRKIWEKGLASRSPRRRLVSALAEELRRSRMSGCRTTPAVRRPSPDGGI